MPDVERERGTLHDMAAAASRGIGRLALHAVDGLGARPRVRGRPFVDNLGEIWIGDDLALCSTPVRSHLVTGPRGLLRIGNGVTIGSGAAIAATDRIEIGDGAHLEPGVMLMDSDYHDAADRGAPGATAPIVIGAHAWLGERVTVLHGAEIGARAHIEPGSVVSGPIPEGAVAAGVPARVVHHRRDGEVRVTTDDLLPRVQRICAEVFALAAPPAPARGPKDIPGWDSLGALRLLVTLEDDLGITLPQSALGDVRDLAGLAELLGRQLDARGAGAGMRA